MKSNVCETEYASREATDLETKRKSFRPQSAGNRAFRVHNKLRFMRTTERKRIGKSNTVKAYNELFQGKS